MTRIKISIGILFILTAVSVFSGYWINKSCRKLTELSTQAETLFSQGDIERTVEVTQQLEREWEKFRSKAAVVVRSNKLADIDRLCARISHLAENESEELPAELTEFDHLLDLLRNAEVFA